MSGSNPSSAGVPLLEASLVERIRKQVVLDSAGQEHRFEELINAREGEKCLVIFIRHFHCGLCQNYLQELARVAPPQQFDSANVRVSVVGHGEASVIKGYTDFLKLPWTVYAQPSKELHKALGMTHSLALGERPDYQKQSFPAQVVTSIANAFKIGGVLSGGESNQNGGELVFEPGFVCSYKHIMAGTRDHTPVPDILSQVGVKAI